MSKLKDVLRYSIPKPLGEALFAAGGLVGAAPLWAQSRGGSLSLAEIAGLVAAALVLGGAGLALDRFAQPGLIGIRSRAAQRRLRDIREGRRPSSYTLYLRPFATEGQIQVPNPRHAEGPLATTGLRMLRPPTVDAEVNLDRAVRKWGRMVALGDPSGLGTAAADRLETPDESWQRVFADLATHASTVLLLPGNGAGARHELGWLVAEDRLDDTVFLIPAELAEGDLADRLGYSWTGVSEVLDEHGLAVPELGEHSTWWRYGDDRAIVASDDAPFDNLGRIRKAIRRVLGRRPARVAARWRLRQAALAVLVVGVAAGVVANRTDTERTRQENVERAYLAGARAVHPNAAVGVDLVALGEQWCSAAETRGVDAADIATTQRLRAAGIPADESAEARLRSAAVLLCPEQAPAAFAFPSDDVRHEVFALELAVALEVEPERVDDEWREGMIDIGLSLCADLDAGARLEQELEDLDPEDVDIAAELLLTSTSLLCPEHFGEFVEVIANGGLP